VQQDSVQQDSVQQIEPIRASRGVSIPIFIPVMIRWPERPCQG